MSHSSDKKTSGDAPNSRPTKAFTIFISGMSHELKANKTNQFVHETFSMYGRYKWTHQSNDWIKVELTNFKKPFKMPNGQSELKPMCKTCYVFEGVAKLFSVEPPDYDSFNDRIIRSRDLNEQLEILSKIFLNESDAEDRMLCVNYLYCLLNFSGIKCQLIPTGSTVTHVGVKNADLDIFINVHDLVTPVSKAQAMAVLSEIQKILKRELKLFIPKPFSARCPIIKIDFSTKYANGLSIDLSASSDQATRNSSLMKTLLSKYPYFKQLASLVKYWFIRCNFIGPIQITSYMCLNLVLFFLQCHKYAPPVLNLESHADDFSGMSPPLHNLFLSFVNFYSKFPYSLLVISTHCGYAPQLETLRRQYNWNATPITIQDPIEADANKGINVCKNFFEQRFRQTFKCVNAFIESQPCDRPNEEVAAKLYAMLIANDKPEEFFSSFAASQQSFQTYRMPALLLDSIHLDNFLEALDRWAPTSFRSVQRVLKDILQVSTTCEDLTTHEPILRQCKVGRFVLTLRKIDVDIILKRKCATDWAKYKSLQDFVESETRIIDEMRNDVRVNDARVNYVTGGGKDPLTLVFSLIINATSYSQISEVQFDTSVSSGAPDNSVQTLRAFLSNYLLSYLSLKFGEMCDCFREKIQ